MRTRLTSQRSLCIYLLQGLLIHLPEHFISDATLHCGYNNKNNNNNNNNRTVILIMRFFHKFAMPQPLKAQLQLGGGAVVLTEDYQVEGAQLTDKEHWKLQDERGESENGGGRPRCWSCL